MSTIFTQASAAAGIRATALVLNARALSTDMAIAKSILTANTQGQNVVIYPQFEEMTDRYGLYGIRLPQLPLNEVKHGYLEEVLKPNFGFQMRQIFDRRLRSLVLDPEEIIEIADLATQLPVMAFSGLLTFDAADAFCDDYLKFLRQRHAMGYDMLLKFQHEDAAFLNRLSDWHLIFFPLFATAFAGLATHQVGSLMMVGGVTAAMSLMLKIAKRGAERSQSYMQQALDELNKASGTTRDVQTTLIKHRPQILEVERRPVPPL